MDKVKQLVLAENNSSSDEEGIQYLSVHFIDFNKHVVITDTACSTAFEGSDMIECSESQFTAEITVYLILVCTCTISILKENN